MDCQEFRDFVLFGRTDVSEKDLPHRTALTDMLFRQYGEAHEALKEELKVCYVEHDFPCDLLTNDTERRGTCFLYLRHLE